MFTLSGKRKLLIRLFFVLLIAGIWSAASGSLTAHASVRLTRSSKKLKYRKSFTLKVRGTKKKGFLMWRDTASGLTAAGILP